MRVLVVDDDPDIREIASTFLVEAGYVVKAAGSGPEAQAILAEEAVSLTNQALWRQPVSRTFHGRDIFMPAGAHLASGTPLAQAGQPVDVGSLVRLPPPTSRIRAGEAEGEVVTVDRFGNVQLSVPDRILADLGIALGQRLVIRSNRRKVIAPYVETFGSTSPGELLAFTDSAGFLSLAVSNGSAAETLSLPPGARVRIGPAPPARPAG